MHVSEIIEKVAAMSKQAEKVNFLKENRTPFLDWVFECSTKKYGLTSNSAIGITVGQNHNKHLEDVYGYVSDSLKMFESRKLTGNAAIEELRNILIDLHPDDGEVLINILDNNLKCGVSFDTYETKVMCKDSSKFEVTLAQHLEKVNGVNPIDGTWFASRKCDGVRCVAKVNLDTNEVQFISRQGKEFTTLDNLKDSAINYCKPLVSGTWYLDGELCKIDENGDEHFDQIVGECKKKDYSIEECCYQLFDIVDSNDFNGNTRSNRFKHRYDLLKELEQNYLNSNTIGKCFCKVLKQELITSQADFDRWEKYVEEGNWEGFMLRKDVPFETGRTKNLLKVKKFFDAEFVVKRVETGTEIMAIAGKGNVPVECVTNLVIEYKGNEVSVGSGLSREQRLKWYDCPNDILGKTICVKYFQESKDKNGKLSLRFPTLKYVYENGRSV